MHLTRHSVEEQYRMLLKIFPKTLVGDQLSVPSEAMIEHCIAEKFCPFAEHALSSVRETSSRKLFLYPHIIDEHTVSPDCWINKTFAYNLAEKRFVRATLNASQLDRIGITFDELLQTVIPEMETIYPFLQIAVDDHTRDLVSYVVLTSCPSAYRA